VRSIDLNCDLAEGAGHDAELMMQISSANIACGAHAGDEQTMRAAVRLAKRHDVAIGAHPGFADRAHFGRRELSLAPADIVQLVRDQIRALQTICAAEGARLIHVKPHGALYNMAARDGVVAEAIASAVLQSDQELRLVMLAASPGASAACRCGLRVIEEAFADRAYEADGSLMPRGSSNALIIDAEIAARQAHLIAREQHVIAANGMRIAMRADTLCIHGDNPNAVKIAKIVRSRLEQAGFAVRPL
jgi:5-oxoprolinase (ATP-hydrolysing) subunit A